MFEIAKQASAAEADSLLHQVYTENPKHWSAGLTRQHFDGGLWLVREASTRKAVGFTGWQVREEMRPAGLKKVGYYSIGILPEYRQRGWAKQAVATMLRDKAAEVDIVKALIHPENAPSIGLAQSLGVKIEKTAAAKVASKLDYLKKFAPQILGSAAGGVGTAGISDMYLHPGQKWNGGAWDDKRTADFASNLLLGAFGGGSLAHGLRSGNGKLITGGASAMLAGPYVKPLAARLPGLVDAKANELNRIPEPDKGDPNALLKGTAIGGGALALLLGALYGNKFLGEAQTSNAIAAQQAKGRVKVTLPTKNPNDGETQVEMPMDTINLSNNLYNQLGRDTRRRLRGESKERKGKFQQEQQAVANLGMTMGDDGDVTKGKA